MSKLLTKEEAEFVASSLEQYVDCVDFVLVLGVSPEKYEKARKDMKKKIKKIRKREDLEEIFVEDELEAYLPLLRKQMEEKRRSEEAMYGVGYD